MHTRRTSGTGSVNGCLETPFRRKLERHKQALKDQLGVSRDDSDNRNKARRTAPPPGGSSSSSTARPPNRSKPPPPPPHTGVAARDPP